MLNSLQKWYNKMGQKFKNFNISPLLVCSSIIRLQTSLIMFGKIKERIVLNIIKRSGQIVPFDTNKIKIAIKKAFISVGMEIEEEKLNKLSSDKLSTLAELLLEREVIFKEDLEAIFGKKLIEIGRASCRERV